MSFGGHVSGSPGRRSWHQERTRFEPVSESPNETSGFRVTAQGGWIWSTTFKAQWFWSENYSFRRRCDFVKMSQLPCSFLLKGA